MNTSYDYAVIGGDMRQVYLTEELAQDSNRICCYALCKSPNKHCYSDTAYVTETDSLKEICNASKCIICPIPFCRNGAFLNQSVLDEAVSIELLLSYLQSGQLFFAGCIPEYFKSAALEMGIQVYDLMDDTLLSFFNTIATAEGAICEAIRQSSINLHQSSCAVLGYGKCGRTISHYLKGMFCHVYAVSNQEKERAEASLIADSTGTLADFKAFIGDFDFIFNTIPSLIVTSELLADMKHSVTIIDIASAPGGTDFAEAKRLGINAVLCPGLPGRYAPSSTAKAIKQTIERILKE